MTAPVRSQNLRVAIRLSVASVAWNAVAGVASTIAGLLGSSLALVGFGLDSVVDGAASVVLIWRFVSEARDEARGDLLESRSARLVALALIVIGAYVGARGVVALAWHSQPQTGVFGVLVASASVLVLPPLAAAKRRTAARLGSRALRADSLLSAMGAALAAGALLGVATAQLLGWWWADSAIALGIALVLVREAIQLLHPGNV